MTALRVAIVGSGPAGFYAAGQLLSDTEFDIVVDMFDRLPTPFGLVRAGVAPDHPKIKSVTRIFDKTASKPGFRYYGHVEIGRDVTTAELDEWYDAVIYAHGVRTGKRGGVPGENLRGNHAAAEVVGWYNGHPDHRDADFDLSCKRAVVIGNGNVAIDVARMLAMSVAELATTDIADHALETLARSQIDEIVVLGRRGAEHASFTLPELLELGKLEGVGIVVDQADLDAVSPDAVRSEVALEKRQTLADYANRPGQSSMPKRIVLRFLSSPVEIRGGDKVTEVAIGRNEIEHVTGTARPTGETETLSAGLVVHAVGYTGSPLEGLPFDSRRGVIPNEAGRIAPGRYVAGWIKRGPSGVIGTNRACAQETVTTLLQDVRDGNIDMRQAIPADKVHDLLVARVPTLIDYDAWNTIDAHEREKGEPHGRPRVKIVHLTDMVAIAKARPGR